MGKYEVTNAEYRKWKQEHDSKDYKDHSLNGERQPAVYVSWENATAFTKWLTEKHEGKYTFRLPSEAEWEYAARAGTQAARFWGDNPNYACQYASVRDQTAEKELGLSNIHNCDDGYAVTAPVGSFLPNAFGLYDMLGNVWEWNEDPWHGNYESAPSDGSVWEEDGIINIRLLRGGSWYNGPRLVRCANRDRDGPDYRSFNIGFRVVVASSRTF